MKKRKRVTARRAKRISRVEASTEGRERPSGASPQWRGYYKVMKKAISLYLDADVLAWFQSEGPGYQTRINRTLRKLMIEEISYGVKTAPGETRGPA